jgi:hypothetical protein
MRTEIRAGERTGDTSREEHPARYAAALFGEDNIRTVLEGLREDSIAELCRRAGIVVQKQLKEVVAELTLEKSFAQKKRDGRRANRRLALRTRGWDFISGLVPPQALVPFQFPTDTNRTAPS